MYLDFSLHRRFHGLGKAGKMADLNGAPVRGVVDCRKLIWPIKLPPIRKTGSVVCKLESNKGAEEPNKSELKKTFCICQLGVRCPFLSLQLATYF